MVEKIASAHITPEGRMRILSQLEVLKLKDASRGGLHELFRRCALAVINSGSHTDDARKLFEKYSNFNIRTIQQDRGIILEIENSPAIAFVDGVMIKGIKEHLFSVLRDIVYTNTEIEENENVNLETSEGITDAVFQILRHADILQPGTNPNLVVCWGGHSINRTEYDYTKKVGYELGLRGLDIGTGCGPGAMKGPMKGATIGHAKQRYKDCRYIGLTEPGIIAAEPPNPIVNNLVILPDIEKRLEAFVRTCHGIVVFPGGAGTAEEILYLVGILLHPNNKDIPFPVIFTGPKESESYFKQINDFIGQTLGYEAQQCYEIIIDDPIRVAQKMKSSIQAVKEFRRAQCDAYYFNWLLKIEDEFQQPFPVDHEKIASLELSSDIPKHQLAANLRRAFSCIVAGNVKETGIRAIEEHGPFILKGEPEIIEPLDGLLKAFVADKRMKLPGEEYVPCYKVVR